MIVCHKHRFIFLKTNKTAGTSVEIALSACCSDSDIVTPGSVEDERVRQEYGGHRPANYNAQWKDYSLSDWRRFVLKGHRLLKFHNHITAAEARPLLGEAIWNGYYKFCFERNPWDRVVSYYYWHFRNRKAPSISEFIASDRIQTLRKRGYSLYTINGELAVDRVCRFENIQADLNEVASHLQLPHSLELPNAKSSTRSQKKHYREILCEDDRLRIAELFSKEIDLFGYSF
jgi:hypothetical protein